MSTLAWLLVGALTVIAAYLLWRTLENARALKRLNADRTSLTEQLVNARVLLDLSEQRRLQLFEQIGTGVVLARFSGEILAVNSAAVRMFGYDSEDELRSQRISGLYLDPSVWQAEMRSLMHETDARALELPLKRKGGALIRTSAAIRVLREAGAAEPTLQWLLTDITSLRAAEERCEKLEQGLRLSQKLQSIGHLSAGVAHEINTPLQYISDSIHLLKQRFEELMKMSCFDNPFEEEPRLTQIEAQIGRAFERSFNGIANVTRIVRAMKEFAHPDQERRSTADINHVLSTVLTISRNEYKHIADVEMDFGDLPPVWCQTGDLNQVFVNLIVNSAHAIEQAEKGRGTIRVVTRAETNHVVIMIADTGCGIPASLRTRIYDPFFTTKPVGKGTGQGLAIAHSVVVDRHGGEIDFDSAPGRGTTFRIRLPIDMRALLRQRSLEKEMKHG